jgi:hypothetical protein
LQGSCLPPVTRDVCVLIITGASLAHACSIKPPLSLTLSLTPCSTCAPLTTCLILLLLLICLSFPITCAYGSIITTSKAISICSSSTIASCCCATLLPPPSLLLLLLGRLHSAVSCSVVNAPLRTSTPARESAHNDLPILALQSWPVPVGLWTCHNVIFDPLPSTSAAAPATSSEPRTNNCNLLLLLTLGIRLITTPILSVT